MLVVKDQNWFRLVIGRLYNKNIRINILQALPFWLGALLTGLVAVMYTKLFTWGEALSHNLFTDHRWILFALTPACFLAAWWVVSKFDKKAGGSGIPQVMAAIELANPRYN